MKKREFNRYEKSVFFGERSIRFVRTATYNPVSAHQKIEKRGSIRTFSRHSALRLRRALSELHLTRSKSFGICLTVPWQLSAYKLPKKSLFSSCVDFDLIYSDYKAAFNRFGVAFRRMFPNSAAIFRHELQTRRMPHCHLVVYFSDLDLPYRVNDVKLDDVCLWLRDRMYELWQSAIKFKFRGGSVEGFYRHGIVVTPLDDLPAIFRYIGDHTSKHKQAQLGYRGKQWGFINRSLLVCRHFTRFDFANSRELVLFQRCVTKLCRFKVNSRRVFGCDPRYDATKDGRINLDYKPFGYKLSTRRRLVSIQFVNFDSARKIFDWIVSQRVVPVELYSRM